MAKIEAVGDVGGGGDRTVVKWYNDNEEGKPQFGKSGSQSANDLYGFAKQAGQGQFDRAAAPTVTAKSNYDNYFGKLEDSQKLTKSNKKWSAIGAALAECLYEDVENAAKSSKISEKIPIKIGKKIPLLVLQTGAMRRDYFKAHPEENKSIMGPELIAPAHSAHYADEYDYGYYSDQDYDYEDYEEGYDDGEYSLYEEAAANLKRAREEFRVAQQLMKWKGRGNSRLLRRYRH